MRTDRTKGDAVIAVAEDGCAKLIQLLSEELWIAEDVSSCDSVGETEYVDTLPGLYYAVAIPQYCGGSCCTQHECAGDCFWIDWDLRDALITMEKDEVTK